jgi:hypothetical protein
MPGVNSKKGELEKEMGMTAIKGMTKKNKTKAQIVR